MRIPEIAAQVARTLEPVTVRGLSETDSQEREISPHLFVGGNTNLAKLGGGEAHASLARERLRSAATLEVVVPKRSAAGKSFALELRVTNVGAGHMLPTSLTELREMWVELAVSDGKGTLLFESGALTPNGDIPAGAMRFGALAGDADGNVTYKPWEATHFLFKRLIPPKGTETDRFDVPLPAEVNGPLAVRARLLYRSAPPKVVRLLLGDDAPELEQVEMASASATVAVEQ